MGPTVPFSEEIHAQKYRGEGESFKESMNRVASALSDDESHFRAFRDIISHMRFLPAGRVQAAMGSTKVITPYNCFVSGTIDDSFVDGPGSIMARATEAATTMRMGGGIGYDFSTLRPRGAVIKKLGSQSSGPVSFMDIFNSVCNCIASSGHRRGAQMGVLRVDHPDIEEFIHAKQNSDRLTAFNISVGVTDRFMQAVEDDAEFDLEWGGEVYKTIRARPLWEMIMRSTWDWAEPGVLFIDRINEMNNLDYCEKIAATNPCGEQPLPPYGACLLGSFNLTQYVIKPEAEGGYFFDMDAFKADIPHVVRAMDNVVDRATYPLEQQEKEAKSKRRMGLGVTGVANAIEAVLGRPCYGEPEYLEYQEVILQTLRDEAYRASMELAKDKGAFPLFDGAKFCARKFVQKLPKDLQADIFAHGIRNSHLISIAPTGTISLAADNISSGIEPVFSYSFERTVQQFDGQKIERVEDFGYRRFGIKGKRTKDVTPMEHVAVLTGAYEFVDSAVSKTCNVPVETTWEDFKEVYVQAWKGGAKGCTTFTTGGKRGGILVEDETEEEEEPQEQGDTSVPLQAPADGAACFLDPVTGRHECE